MASRDDLLDRLSASCTIEMAGGVTFLITHSQGEELDTPIRLELENELFERYVASLAANSEGGDLTAAVGLVRIHVEEMVESSSASQRVLHCLGVRRSRTTRRPEWFVERSASAAVAADEPPTMEWRA